MCQLPLLLSVIENDCFENVLNADYHLNHVLQSSFNLLCFVLQPFPTYKTFEADDFENIRAKIKKISINQYVITEWSVTKGEIAFIN